MAHTTRIGGMRHRIVRLVTALSFLLSASVVTADDAGDKHLGVATCAGSTCHGSTRPFADSRIRQDEYFIWQRKDAHARAYDTLRSERSQSIARKLGVADAATAPRCLVCHADNVPEAQRGERFQLSDGIGCETCHGASEHWIGPHTAGYIQRKGPQDPARNWAAGQAEGARKVLENLSGPRFGNGMFPELAFFDCNACHHSLVKADRARPQRSGGLAAGAVPLADSQLVMLIRWLEVGDAGTARKWHDQWVALQGAGQRGPAEIRSQAKTMLATLDNSIVPQVRSRTLDDAQLRKLLKSIVSDARGAHVGDFSDAEQTAMAVSVLTTALSERGAQQVSAGLRAAVDELYAQVMNRDDFQPERYSKSIERVAVALGLPEAG